MVDELHARWGRAAFWLVCGLVAVLLVVGIANDAH